MLNPKVKKIYDVNTVKVLENYAEKMESSNRHVVLALPAERVKGMVFPQFVGIENYTKEDSDEVLELYGIITEDRPAFDDDDECMIASDYTRICNRFGGVELWVK